MYIIPCQQSKESRGNSLTISNDDRFRPRSLKCPGNEKQTPTGLTYLRLCSNRPQANQSRWIPYIHYNRPQTGRRAAFDRSPRARRPLTVKSRPARDLAGRDRNLRMRSALLLRVSSLYRSTQSRNRMSITSKFDPHHSPSHHTTSRSYADCYLKVTVCLCNHLNMSPLYTSSLKSPGVPAWLVDPTTLRVLQHSSRSSRSCAASAPCTPLEYKCSETDPRPYL